MPKKNKVAAEPKQPKVEETPVETTPEVKPLNIDNGLIQSGDTMHIVIDGKIVETHQGSNAFPLAVSRYKSIRNLG